jgi:hypothetical protein
MRLVQLQFERRAANSVLPFLSGARDPCHSMVFGWYFRIT